MSTPDQPSPWDPSAQQPPGYAAPSQPGWGPPPAPGGQPGWGPPPGYAAPSQPGWGPPPAGYQPGPYDDPGLRDPVWAVLAHASLYVVPLIGPLVIYLVYKDSSPYTRHHAAEALNLAITLAIATVASLVLMLLLVGFVMIIAVVLWGLVAPVLGILAASRRQAYRYPVTLHLVS
jgi:uncharacterized Tic20 family protein